MGLVHGWHVPPALLWLVAVATAARIEAAGASALLLDEYWTPEITQDGATVCEADALERHDPSLAKAGEVSAEIANAAGHLWRRLGCVSHWRSPGSSVLAAAAGLRLPRRRAHYAKTSAQPGRLGPG